MQQHEFSQVTLTQPHGILTRTGLEITHDVRTGAISATHVVGEILKRIDRFDPLIKAYLLVDREGALRKAHELDVRIKHGAKVGMLAGIPIAIKDNICTLNMRTTCASKILENFIPPYDAHVIQRLRNEDAIIIGKTNMDEFGMGSSCEQSAFFPTRNPWNTDFVPGGSSGGSAAAVAAHLAIMALGSDTGGSIRQPASFCGVVGLKPTYGRVSRYGLIAFASSLDHIGLFSRNVRDAALLLKTIAGHDPRDSTCAALPVPDYLSLIEEEIDGLTVGLPVEYFSNGLDSEVAHLIHHSISVMEKAGARVEEISLPHTEYGIAAYYIISSAEASSNLARYDGMHYGERSPDPAGIITTCCRTRSEKFGDEVKRRIMLGTYVLSAGYYDAYYLRAMKVRRLIKQDFDDAFKKVDVIACPASPTPPFRLGDKITDPLAMYLSDVYTVCANLAGLPGISVPCGFTKSGLPVGLQLISKPFAEDILLRAARSFEGNKNASKT